MTELTLDLVLARRVIPVVVLKTMETALPLARALAAGGLPVAEVTFRTPAAADAIRTIATETDVLVGAGTVVRPEQADAAVKAGARFVVTPGFSALGRAPVRRARGAGDPRRRDGDRGDRRARSWASSAEALPGGGSWRLPLLKALAGPFPDVRFVPTGGVSAANMARTWPVERGCRGWQLDGRARADRRAATSTRSSGSRRGGCAGRGGGAP